MQYQIYWQPQTELHELQGATVDFIQENQVHYTNHFLPSGKVIASWTDAGNYYGKRSFSTLPRLKPGKVYRSRRCVKNSKRMHAYLNWTFFDEKNQVINNQYQNSDYVDIKVPTTYDHYRLDLMSAGMGEFTFYEVDLAEKISDGWLFKQDQAITDHLWSYLAIPNQVLSKTLRVIVAEPELRQTAFPTPFIKDSPQAVLYLATDLCHYQDLYHDDLIKLINQAQKTVRAKDVEFVGYGLVSSLFALHYRQSVTRSQAVIADPTQVTLPVGYRNYSPALTTFLAEIPAKINALLTDKDSFLVNASLGQNPSPVQANRPQPGLLQQLAYVEWPETKQAKKERLRHERLQEKNQKKQGMANSKKKNTTFNQPDPSQSKVDRSATSSALPELSATEKLATGQVAIKNKSGRRTADQPLPPLGPNLGHLTTDSQNVDRLQAVDQVIDQALERNLPEKKESVSAATNKLGSQATAVLEESSVHEGQPDRSPTPVKAGSVPPQSAQLDDEPNRVKTVVSEALSEDQPTTNSKKSKAPGGHNKNAGDQGQTKAVLAKQRRHHLKGFFTRHRQPKMEDDL